MSYGHTRAGIREQLQRLGVETVAAQYDGCGDSGQIEDPAFGPVQVPPALATSVLNLFYDLLEVQYAGWEINEGSYGEFVWNVKADRITLMHNGRVEVYEEQTL